MNKFAFLSADGEPFKATLNPGMFCDFDFVKANFSDPHIQVADARSPGRFLGTETEPRPNFPSGHIPHSKSLHYAKFLEPETKLMKDPEELKQELIFKIHLLQPVGQESQLAS